MEDGWSDDFYRDNEEEKQRRKWSSGDVEKRWRSS